MTRIYVSVAVALLALAGCGGDEPPVEPAPAAPVAGPPPKKLAPATEIDWHKGGVDEAFELARASTTPIFLYWGAEWCPPCHAISATVFKSPEFIERSRLFVPVYLDGDTENAQEVGERFGVRGYPTMIVFDSEGVELTRIPGGIDMQAYANVLDLTLSNSSSSSDLLGKALASGELAADECTQLAFHSWGQDTTILEDMDESAAFRSLYEACPDGQVTERSILYFTWLDSVLDAAEAGFDEDAGINVDPLDDAERTEALSIIDAVLSDQALARNNAFSVIFGGARYVSVLTMSGSEKRAALTQRFYDRYDAMFADEKLYKRERLYTLTGKIEFERIDDETAAISEALRAEITAAAQWADTSTPNALERQPIINAMGNILEDAGMDELGREILLAELVISQQPYYFMTGLADIEQRAGNFAAALNWLKKAYDASRGPATRFQWGYYYLTGLLEMQPENVQLIHDTTVRLIEEVQSGGGLYQRPKAQLERLEARLREWSETHDGESALENIRGSVLAVCANDAERASRETCEAFLEPA